MTISGFCCCEPCLAIIHIQGCEYRDYSGGFSHYPIPGATFTYTQGGFTSPTYTTDSSGSATIFVHTPGASATFTISTTASHYNATTTTTITLLTCATIPHVKTYTLGVAPVEGYQCSDDGCCPTGGIAPFPTHVYPDTLYLTDNFGMVTLTRDPFTLRSWSGTATRTAAHAFVKVPTDDDPTGHLCHCIEGVEIPIRIGVFCGLGGWTVLATGKGCNTPTSPLTPGIEGSGGIGYFTRGPLTGDSFMPDSCPPSLSIHFTASFDAPLDPCQDGFPAWNIWPDGFDGTLTQ